MLNDSACACIAESFVVVSKFTCGDDHAPRIRDVFIRIMTSGCPMSSFSLEKRSPRSRNVPHTLRQGLSIFSAF